MKKVGVEYGAATGAGVVTGAIIGGPGGALAGGIIGASVITVHLIMDHPQATLDDGAVLLFTLNEPLQFYVAKSLYQVVVLSVGKDQISGYLQTPKYGSR